MKHAKVVPLRLVPVLLPVYWARLRTSSLARNGWKNTRYALIVPCPFSSPRRLPSRPIYWIKTIILGIYWLVVVVVYRDDHRDRKDMCLLTKSKRTYLSPITSLFCSSFNPETGNTPMSDRVTHTARRCEKNFRLVGLQRPRAVPSAWTPQRIKKKEKNRKTPKHKIICKRIQGKKEGNDSRYNDDLTAGAPVG